MNENLPSPGSKNADRCTGKWVCTDCGALAGCVLIRQADRPCLRPLLSRSPTVRGVSPPTSPSPYGPGRFPRFGEPLGSTSWSPHLMLCCAFLPGRETRIESAGAVSKRFCPKLRSWGTRSSERRRRFIQRFLKLSRFSSGGVPSLWPYNNTGYPAIHGKKVARIPDFGKG